MTMPLVVTKVKVPPVRENRVLRPRLLEQLKAGLGRKLTLLSSPAGFGKTTLLSEFAVEGDRPAAWFSIDEEDDDSNRFLSYLIASLETIDQGFGESMYPLLQTPKPERIETLLAVVINEIEAAFPPFVLIIDDYHLISSPDIHQAIAFLIEHLPEQMHMVIATRADPPLALSRLRVRAQLSEIRENDLRFSNAEAAEFLNQVMELDLADEQLAVMERRTEGWAAGLQLAALSLQDQADKERFVEAFAGSNRYILDYLGQEVLDHQDGQVRDFLLQTSILERLNASLCEAVTGASNSQEILEYLERNHLFILPLDQERTWYRYHSLFQDFLLKSLQRSQSDQIAVLHQKASIWYEGQGYVDEAIEHALSAGDHQRAMDLIESTAELRLMRSEASSIIRWIETLPEEVVLSRPTLCLTEAWALMLRGSPLEKVDSRLKVVESAHVADQVLGSAAALRAFLSSIKGDAEMSLELSLRALQLIPEDHLFLRSMVADNLGMVYLMRGDFDASIESFTQAAEISRQAGNTMIAVGALCNMAGIWMLQGQLKRAWSANEQALELATDRRGRRLPVAGKALLGLGEIAREWNDLDAATGYLNEGLELFRLFGELGSVLSYVTLARIKEVQGDLDAAQEIVDLARQLAIQFDASTMDDELVDAYQAQLWIVQGKNEQVDGWVEYKQLKKLVTENIGPLRFNPMWEIYSQTLARVYISQGKYDDALRVIEPMLEIAEASQRMRSVLRVHAMQAVIYSLKGNTQIALEKLEKALNLAKAEGFVRTFLDEGKPMVQLLYQAAARGVVPDYAEHLLAAYASSKPAEVSIRSKMEDHLVLLEPLSARENEVLKLIADGKTNQEIAVMLHISLSTVKGHISNIYGKLSVHNRTQAVARANELGILTIS
ncbi:MAG: HTH-type transcriptional regulator MalT [Anaerolineales bacterium]|nr:HTH-type transcriptional regulator MalT [Anaerolineales bacterium]